MKFTIQKKLREHTTHFYDCGCLSFKKDQEIASLRSDIKELVSGLGYALSGICRQLPENNVEVANRIEELIEKHTNGGTRR